MQSVGWGFLVIILLSGFRLLVRAWAWTLCTPADAGLRVRDTFPAFLTGDALGNLTPLGLFASEATKAVYVRHRVPLGDGGLGPDDREPDLHAHRRGGHRQRHARAAARASASSHGLEVVVPGRGRRAWWRCWSRRPWIVGRQIKVMTGILDWLHRRSLAPHALAGRLEKLRTLEDTVYGFHRQDPARLSRCWRSKASITPPASPRCSSRWPGSATPPTLLDRLHPRDGEPPDQRGVQVRADAAGGRRGGIRAAHDRPRLHERDGRHAGAGPEGPDAGLDGGRRVLPGPLARRRRRAQTSRRPAMALPMVTSSAYSRSLPTGTPMAMRVTRTPRGLISLAR